MAAQKNLTGKKCIAGHGHMTDSIAAEKAIDENKIRLIFVLIIVLSCAACVVVSLHQVSFRVITIDHYEDMLGEKDFSIDYIGKDTMEKSDRGTAQVGAGYKYLVIKGWCGDKNADQTLFQTSILLKDRSSENRFYQLSTEMVLREDLVSYGENQVSLERAGFIAKVKKERLKKGVYEVFILYGNKDEEELIKTGKKLEVK